MALRSLWRRAHFCCPVSSCRATLATKDPKAGVKPAEKSVQKSPEKSAAKLAPKSVQKSPEKSAAKSAAKLAPKPAEKFVKESAKHSAEKSSKKSAENLDTDELVVPKVEVIRFLRDSMVKAGADPEHAEIFGHHLMTADHRGHFTHGLSRLPMYYQSVKKKQTDGVAKPKTVQDHNAIALVDGCNGLGHVIGKYCMELAICKAWQYGVGVVNARRSNHFGICGYYTLMAVDKGMIGICCTNTSPYLTPTHSKQSGLGSNPISLAMGAGECDQFVLDMSTTSVTVGKIEHARTKGTPLPEGWALDSSGRATTNADEAIKSLMLTPLGGTEERSGYKGYGLSLMVEVLSGVLGGSNYGPNIPSRMVDDTQVNLGHCFIAINPSAFGIGSHDRLAKLLNQLRTLPMAGTEPVLVAGDRERFAMAKTDNDGGITYLENQLKSSAEFAAEIKVEPLRLITKCH